MQRTLLLMMETVENRLAPGSRELLAFARRLSEFEELTVLIAIAGEAIAAEAEKLATETGARVIALEGAAFHLPNPHSFAQELLPVIEEYKPRYSCALHTMRGAQLAASLAAAAGQGCITAVETVGQKDGAPLFQRSLYNGKIIQSLQAGKEGAAITVLPGAFAATPAVTEALSQGMVIHAKPQSQDNRYMPTGIDNGAAAGPSLLEADVIVAAGKGIGSKENLVVIEETARLFRNAAIGASRAACDLGWLPYPHQVGATGKTVAPRLYMACGISGSQQHIVGMRNSRLIVAVNRDPDAPIFRTAHIGVVDDLLKFLPVFVSVCRE